MAEVHETDNHLSENGKNIEIQKIKRHIKALKDVNSNRQSLFSAVIGPGQKISDLITFFESWKTDPTTNYYMYSKDAITFAQEILRKYSNVPANGLIIYTGIVYPDDGNDDVKIVIEPFKHICTVGTYQTLFTFYIKPLEDLLKSEPIPLWQPSLKNFFDAKKSVYGVDTWKRLGDVKILFVSENLDINYYRLKNTRTGEVVTKHLNKQQEDDQSNFRGSKTIYTYWRKNDELEVLEKTPLLDWLAQVHQDKLSGCKLVFVSDTDTTIYGLMLYHCCGGIGGILGDHVNIHGWVQSFVVLLVAGLVAYLVIRSTLF